MKIWKKIFIYSFVIFLILFNFGAFILIENSHNISLSREVDRGMSEHSSIYSGIDANLYVIKDMLKYSDDLTNTIKYRIIENYLKSFHDKDVYIEVLDKYDNKIFSNLDFKIELQREELKNPLLDRRRYIIRDIDEKTFLFITNLLDIGGEYLKFSYIRNITYVYEDRKEQYDFFIKLDIIVSVILAGGMYIISKYITKPISKLTKLAQIIAKGNFSERVNIHTRDEIGTLAESFNEMACAVEEKINEFERNAKAKQRFIDNLTHELKTPLTSIIGYADFLRSTKYNEETFLKGLDYIFKEGKRLEEMSYKMMDLILLQRESLEMKKENIKNILIEVKGSLKPKLEKKNLDLLIDGEELENLVDKGLIKILIMNLIDNSIKASEKCSKIYLNVYKNKESKTVIEVKDKGMGIAEEDLPKVFEPFYMVDKSRTRDNNGAGLGLSICAEITKIHEAKIDINSKINEGTTIKILLN